ncbi:MAG: hypothetical protein ACYTXY_49555, partial [Nostoc sp.]
MNSIYSFELYVVLVQSEVFRDRLAKLSFKSHIVQLQTMTAISASKRILLIDDEPDLQRVVQTCLEKLT